MVEADTNDPDLGQRVLEKIHKDLCIDEPWTTRGDRWFSWIGHRLAQRVSASKPSDDDGIVLSRIEATCVVVADIAAEPSDVVRVLPRINRHAVGSAYTYWPDTHSISADAVAYVHDQTLEWRTNQLGALAILQLWLCETEAAWLAEKTGGRIAVREHPTSGRRLEPDEMLNVLDTQFAADGRKQSLFADKFEMENIAEITRQSTSAASLGGDAGGVTIEVPFGDYTSLIQLNTQEPHRRLGNGLTALLRLPLTVTPDEADLLASMLNAREAAGESKATHYGAWCWDIWPTGGPTLAFRAFMPNSLYRPGIAQDVSYAFIKRAQWADALLNGQVSNVNIWERLADRFGAAAPESEED